MLPVGPMQLEQPQAPDLMEPYFTGTQPSGGYWTTLARLSAHDHSGGLMGNPVAVVIPDGSITSADLDASVLAPYAPTDGSKPFTGAVEMEADAVVRDRLSFGPQGTAATPDLHLTRTGAGALRVDGHLGVGATPGAWSGTVRALVLGAYGALMSGIEGSAVESSSTTITYNSVYSGPGFTALGAAPGMLLAVGPAGHSLQTAPAVAAGAAQTYTPRLTVDQNGFTTFFPVGAAGGLIVDTHVSSPRLATGTGTNLALAPASGVVYPSTDNATALGAGGARWTAVYAANGTIQTSDPAQKTAVVPVDPQAALADVLAAEVIAYELPCPTEEDPEATMAHVGFNAATAPARLVVGRRSARTGGTVETSLEVEPQTTASIALAAIQALAARVAALEGAAA